MTTDYVSRITPPVCEQEPGSVYDRIMTAIQMAREKKRYVDMKKVFKEAYALFDEYRNAIPNSLFGDIVKNGILENTNYTPLHGMVMACLYAAFDRDDETLEFLVANVKDQPGYVYFKPIISYYRSKRILDDYAAKERTEYIRSLVNKEIELKKSSESTSVKLSSCRRNIMLTKNRYPANRKTSSHWEISLITCSARRK